ncbi:hypothetical protein LA76x_1198 [Lysobacter antibioticus]|uniref:Uncharacterized protein n=1 Tax=Lysobacter antibioticus TaxID=84531 RepID=A0A0S2F7E5_LYSAN|nr:hypothetical protein LA76x_1198 [Lysobacter antibioticus]
MPRPPAPNTHPYGDRIDPSLGPAIDEIRPLQGAAKRTADSLFLLICRGSGTGQALRDGHLSSGQSMCNMTH